jgi:hypothetical protein
LLPDIWSTVAPHRETASNDKAPNANLCFRYDWRLNQSLTGI